MVNPWAGFKIFKLHLKKTWYKFSSSDHRFEISAKNWIRNTLLPDVVFLFYYDHVLRKRNHCAEPHLSYTWCWDMTTFWRKRNTAGADPPFSPLTINVVNGGGGRNTPVFFNIAVRDFWFSPFLIILMPPSMQILKTSI